MGVHDCDGGGVEDKNDGVEHSSSELSSVRVKPARSAARFIRS